MRIAIATFNLEIPAGGNRLIFEMAQGLKREGHVVTIYAPKHDPRIFAELTAGLDIRVVEPPEPLRWQGEPQGMLQKAWWKMRERRRIFALGRKIAEAIDSETTALSCHDFAYPVAYFFRRRHPKARVIWVMNEPPFGYLPKRTLLRSWLSRVYNALRLWLDRKYFAAMDLAVTLDAWDRDWAIARGIRGEIVWGGTDFASFFAPVRPLDRAKPIQLLTIGNPNRYRRYEDVLGAVSLLVAAKYDVRLSVVARNIWHEDAYCAELTALAGALGIADRVKFYFSGISEEELQQTYRDTTVFIHPIYVPPPRNGSTWGLVVFEAMAAGKPVVLCRTAGAAEPITDGVHALFVDPMSPEDIAAKVRLLVDSPERYLAMATAGQAFVKEHLSWKQYTDRVIELFTETAKR